MTDSDVQTFSSWLRRRRKSLDLTQQQLAQRSRCSVDTIRKIESGERRPSHQIAELLAVALAIPSDNITSFVHIARMSPGDLQDSAIAAFAPHAEPQPATLVTHDTSCRTVAFLMGAVQGCAALWQLYPHHMRLAYARYLALLEQAAATYHGEAIATTDTAAYTTFTTIDEAIAAALHIQHIVDTTEWEGIGTIPVTVALHMGTVSAHDPGAQAYALSQSAALCAIGHPGQILLSPAAQLLLSQPSQRSYTVHDLGVYHIPSVAQPHHVFQISALGQRVAFPSLKARGNPSSNLPADLPPIIGRAQDVAEICAFLTQPHVRLLTLAGIGGIGKTRLAYEVAASLLPDFRHQVMFTSLAPLTDASFVLPTIAQGMGITQNEDIKSALLARLADRPLLLVLDNFEHVLDAAPLVSELLRAAPQLKILATSRARLRLHQEYTFPVSPLSTPQHDGATISLEQAQASSAVLLFVQRAQMCVPRFVLTEANAAAVAAICTHLDGIPLAIELAAARISLLPPSALLERLYDRFAFLTNGAVDRPARQRTLRNAIDWSYNLLTQQEQRLFRWLGVFVSGATLEAITYVAHMLSLASPSDIDTLASLQHKSFLEQIEQGDQPRFTMLATIRAYAIDRLAACGEMDQAWQCCADYYCRSLEQIDPDFLGAQQEARLNDIALEHNNFRAVLSWALDRQDGAYRDTAMRICSRLWRFWHIRGFLCEGREWLHRALEYADPTPSALRASILYGLGLIAQTQGDLTTAAPALQQSLQLWQELQLLPQRANVLNSLGVLSFNQGHYEKAEHYHTECAAIVFGSENVGSAALALNHLGNIAYKRGDVAKARALSEQALALLRETQAPKDAIARIKAHLGNIARVQQDFIQAANWLYESATIYQELAHVEGILLCLENLTDLAIDRSQPQLAAYLIGAADQLYEQVQAIRTPEQQRYHMQQMTIIHQQIHQQTWASAWSRGKATPIYLVCMYTFNQLLTRARQNGETRSSPHHC